MRTTIDLDENVNRRLRRRVSQRGLNRFINEAVAEKVQSLEREELQVALKEGYIARAAETDSLDEEWQTASLENWPE